MFFSFHPNASISEAELSGGLRKLIYEGIFAQIMGTFTGGAFLVAFALSLGASNLSVGLIAAIGPLTQILQIPTIHLVEKTGNRKLLVIFNYLYSRLFWFVVAAVPWFAPKPFRVPMFLAALMVYYTGGTIANLSLTSWMRDLIPDSIRGRYVAKRMALMMAIGAVLSLITAVGVDFYKNFGEDITIYSIYFGLGGIFGLFGLCFMMGIPEPPMAPRPKGDLLSAIKEPFTDINFRHLLIFLGAWNFAVNFAAPFFTVYMLKRLSLGMTVIIGLSVFSQIINVMFLRIWGILADRFSNKSVLLVVCTLFLLTTAAWPFTTMPGVHLFSMPLLIAIHGFAGMSSAGIMLCTGNIALNLAPRGKATAYLAVNALLSGCTATVASILGGLTGTWLEDQRLTLTLRWLSVENIRWKMPAVDIMGLDFVFILSCVFGLYALHRLLSVRESGEVEAEYLLDQFGLEIRKAVANLSNIEGLLDLIYFPYERLRDLFHLEREENGE
jgi:MFS family permease